MRIAAGFSRKVGMLHKMVDAAANGDLKYSKVIAYIESQCVEEEVVSDDDGEDDDMTNYGDDASSAWPTPKNSNRRFDGGSRNAGATSAAAPGKAKKPRMKTVPNEELRKELWYDSQGHSLLRKAVLKSAPHKLLAKLCELCPEAAHVEDSKGRLVLHHACRLPVNEQTEAILLLLLQTHVLGVIHRDSGGRTPLHYLFWYHAAQRSVEIVTAFCGRIRKTKFYALRQPQESGSKVGSTSLPPLPEIPTPNASHSVPNTAAIIPDSQHGCLPIHYAVMEGASVDALTMLLQAYPLSKHVVDRYGQTPLHWYLGGHYFCQSTHVSGCERDPNARPWYSSPIDANVVRLLSSSRVARTGDNQGLTPLHWAACYWAHAYHYQALSDEEDPADFPLTVSTTKLIVDHHIGALGQKDHRQQTPLMVLFQTTFMLQSGYKGPLLPPRFAPTLPCVQLLLEGTLSTDKPVADENRHSQPKNKAVELSRGKRRGCVTTLEDASGDLPLHAAVSTAAPLEIVEAILLGHDGALLHSNDSSRVPLHCAFGAAHSAQLQHKDVVSLLLSKTPGLLDGRLALKMEDSTGQYPIHLACQNNASIDILQLLVKAYPKTALLQNQNGCLPVHTVVSSHVLVSALSLGKAASERVRGEDDDAPDDACVNEMRQERQRLFVAQARQKKLHDIQETREKILTLIEPILLSEKANTHLTLADEGGYLPLHFVVLFGAEYETLYRVLRACPVAALQLTNDGKSVLDLHEQRLFQNDWKEVRQLLFSYAPTLESHRHRVELLKQCVEIIVQEVGATSHHGAGQSSFHWNAEQRLKETEKSLEENPELQLTQTLSTNIDVVKSSLSLSQQSMTYHHMVKAVSQVSRVKSINAAAAESSVKGKFTPRRRKGNQPSRGPKSFELSASLSDNAPVSSSPRAQAQSKYDEGDTKLNYILSDTEYDEDDSYFSDDDDEEEEYLSDEDHTESECDTTNRDSVTNGAPTHTFSSDFEASKSHDFHPMSSHSTLEEIFMSAKLKAMKSDNEEKKEEFETRSREGNASLGIDTTTSSRSLMAPACDSDDSMLAFAVRPEWFSEVGLRLWSFFALYRDKNNPNDNYSSQVTSIFNEIEYDCVETLVMLPLPSCARVYFPDTPTKDLKRLIFREAANPKCREFMHRMCFFIGTYEFQSDDGSDIAVYQSEDGSSIVIKAHEWLFTTEESTDAVIPGVSEATIWKTGEVPAEVGLAFRSVRRSVRMHFTTRQDVYDSEVQSRVQAGVPVESRGFEAVKSMLPLLNHYNANDCSRRENRIYLSDVQDGRFSTLQLCHGNCVGVRDTISLADYPFALVYPDTSAESLDSLYSNLGIAGSPRLQTVCKEMGNALSELHRSGIVHSNFSMSNISLSKNVTLESEGETSRSWILSGLSFSSPVVESKPNYAGGVTKQGYGQFATGTLPPELFVIVSPAELVLYRQYWASVEAQFGVKVDKRATDPVVDLSTGQAFVVKCHYVPLTLEDGNERSDKPRLPYDLVQATTSLDLWAFGLVLFHLCAGRPLFPTDERTGHLLELSDICGWTIERAREYVYEFVADNTAQDLLLRLLAPFESRRHESMDAILKHAFFAVDGEAAATAAMISHHQMEAAAHKRRQQNRRMEVSEASLLEERTVKFPCWDFSMLERVYMSPTETMTRLLPPQPWRKEGSVLPFPCALLVLPYRQEDAKVNDEHAGVAFGREYLEFCKAVYFCAQFKRTFDGGKSPKASKTKLSVEAVFKRLNLNESDFRSIKESLSDLATKHVYQFRESPAAAALKVAEQRLERLLATFEGTGAYVHLVDEHKVTVAARPAGNRTDPYPLLIPEDLKAEALKHGVALTHLCSLYARGCSSRGLLGLFRLLVDPTASSEDSVPASWVEAGSGLPHAFDESSFLDEIRTLQDILGDAYGGKYRVAVDDVEFWRDFLYRSDPRRSFCELRRVSASNMCLWTSREGSAEMADASRSVSFKDALRSCQVVVDPASQRTSGS